MSSSWFDTARFGMFIHWGLSSVGGWELSWPLVGGVTTLPRCGSVSIDEYYACAERFDPQLYEPRAWARRARELGMRYAVLTAKHHDGFSLFDTALTDFSVMHSPYRTDIVRGFVDAFRDEGLHVGLYYSLSDWHHPAYPAFTEAYKPYDFFRLPRPTPEQWSEYLAFLFGQVRELLTNYGPIDVIWFDGAWERNPPEMWHAAELRQMIKSLQPQILINDRLPGCGDFETPEQFVPPRPPSSLWETCMTMNESWGYNPTDTQYKSGRQMIHALCEVAGRGGNLLLNVSPMADGRLPLEQTQRLDAIARWTKLHGEAIVDTQPGLEPWQFYGPSTRRGDTIYLHLLMRPYDSVAVRGLPIRRISSVRLLSTGASLAYSTRGAIIDEMFNADPLGELTVALPESALDDDATVIAVDVHTA